MKGDKIFQKEKNEYEEALKNSLNGLKFKVYDKIDKGENIIEIIKKEIENFKNPKGELEIIDNLIKLDYIISEKYKSKEINIKTLKSNDYLKMAYLSMPYKNKNCKIYIDKIKDRQFYSQLQQYYLNENVSKNKIRIRLKIDKEKLKDEEKVKYITNKIKENISQIMGIPDYKLHVTNVRRNCLLLDIIYISFRIRKFFVELIDKDRFAQNRDILKTFLMNIQREMGNNDQISENIYEDIIEIRTILENIVISPDLHFNAYHNKKLGDFGLDHWLIFPYHKTRATKNGITYYYPNLNFEGYGLYVHPRNINNIYFSTEQIFDKNGDWCIAYSNLSKTRISLKINNTHPEILYDPNHKGYRLSYQCKIYKPIFQNITDEPINLNRENEDYIVPYRLLIEHLDD